MPTPVSIIDSGGVPIVNTPFGTPMTPVGAPLYGTPVTLVEEGSGLSGIPVHLVNDDLTDWGQEMLLDPEFTDTANWTEGVGWVVAGGVCTVTAAASGTVVECNFADRIDVTLGDEFKWEIVVNSITQGGFALAATAAWLIGPTLVAPGTYTGMITASASSLAVPLRVRSVGVTSGVLERFSFRRISS